MYLKKYNLKNKIALVTGAGKGLGRACAIALAEAGANLIIISRTKKDLDQVSKIIKKFKSKCKSYVCDITNYDEIKTIVNKPIKFIGTGEKMSALDVFHPDRMADRILGMGDVVSLVERAQEQFDIEQAKKINKKIAKNKFGFDDFLSQIQQVKKMGDMKDLVKMIPGVGNKMKDVDIDESSFKNIEVIINSMTIKEKQNPNILDHSRKIRIAKGSGRGMDEVNQLIKQFNQMNKMMKMMQGGKGQHLMQMFQGMK